jgi:4-alpha-glucanotransferase
VAVGLGEILDLKPLADWCCRAGFTLIQILPLNDTGFDFQPYSPESSFALDPLYLSLGEKITTRFTGGPSAHGKFKGEKLARLWTVFQEHRWDSVPFNQFKEKNFFWLRDYSLYKVLKQTLWQIPWEEWPALLRDRDPGTLKNMENVHAGAIEFHEWLQWQLHEQMTSVKTYLNEKGIHLMGDVPFFVARDSADVWARQASFKLDLSVGAPPDQLSALSQNWGMPPYRWDVSAQEGYKTFIQKLHTMEPYYDAVRVDHVMGFFRVFTFDRNLKNHFDPEDKTLWETQGRQLLTVFLENTTLLPCGENLGTVPDGSNQVLEEFGIPRWEVQRWSGGKETPCTVVTLSTHDTSPFVTWWTHETSEDEKRSFLKWIGMENAPLRSSLVTVVRKALEKAGQSQALFAIHPIQDWLALDDQLTPSLQKSRINIPGTLGPHNWSWICPVSLEELNKSPVTERIHEINIFTKRGPHDPTT